MSLVSDIFLNIRGERYQLKHGINLVGTADNDRFSAIKVIDETLSAKHAAIRCSSSNRLEVMDLCSDGGVFVDQRRLQSLEWNTVATCNRLMFGTLECSLEKTENMFDDDSTDFIDCSLEEPCLPIRKKNSSSDGASQEKQTGATKDQSSFFFPATQLVDSENFKSQPSKTGNRLTDSDDDEIIIPETQDVNDEESGGKRRSQSIWSKVPLPGLVVHSTKETEDYIQLTGRDDENSSDGMFNNSYIEESQNLLQNLSDCYRNAVQTDGVRSQRVSKDSASFQRGNNSTAEMSRIQWNESCRENANEKASLREYSATPELILPKRTNETDVDDVADEVQEVRSEKNQSVKEKEKKGTLEANLREDSATPELIFPKTTNVKLVDVVDEVPEVSVEKNHSVNEKEKKGTLEASLREDCVTPELHIPKRTSEKEVTNDADEVSSVSGKRNKSLKVTEKKATLEVSVRQESKGSNKHNVEVTTDREPEASTVRERLRSTSKTPETASTGGHDTTDAYDLVTQPFRGLPSNVFVKVVDLKGTKHTESLRKNKMVNIDPYLLPTQPLAIGEKSPIHASSQDEQNDAYLLPTQPLNESKLSLKRKPVIMDPYMLPTQPLNNSKLDPYDMQTQPLESPNEEEDDPFLWDTISLDIPLSAYKEKGVNVDISEAASPFHPPANSTVRSSLLPKPHLEISPSSNKENHDNDGSKRSPSTTLLNESENLNDELCLAATLPIGEKEQVAPPVVNNGRTKRVRTKAKDRKDPAEPELLFKAPQQRPTAVRRKGPEEVQFQTPEHSRVPLPKRDAILAMSEVIETMQREKPPRANQYLFGSSSDEDFEPETPFGGSKRFTTVSAKFLKEEQEARDDAARAKKERTKRNRKVKEEEKPSGRISKEGEVKIKKESEKSNERQKRHKKVEEDKKDIKAGGTSGGDVDAGTSTRSARRRDSVKKPAIDESVEYKPPVDLSGATPPITRGRQRKRASVNLDDVVPNKIEKQEAKPGPEAKQTSKSRKDSVAVVNAVPAMRNKAPSVSVDERKNSDSVASASDSSGGGTRKSSRASKPKLMFTRMKSDPYRTIITRAGAQIVDTPEEATVLVSDRIYRTYKFLCAIAKGIPIVGQSYLEELKAVRRLPDPWQYILHDGDTERRYKFTLANTLRRAQLTKVFEGYSVYLTSNTTPPPNELQLIITCAGGNVIKFPNQQSVEEGKVFVVSDPKDKGSWPVYKQRYKYIDIVSTEGLMVSVMQHYINFQKYRLC